MVNSWWIRLCAVLRGVLKCLAAEGGPFYNANVLCHSLELAPQSNVAGGKSMKGLEDDHWSLAGGLSWVFWVISAVDSQWYKVIGWRQEGIAYLVRDAEFGTVF
ncbi:hypothetical protein BDR06DRAFT_970018 [Suillus hirtellus]|nr:hypothetical protein BDR06DRAFT_970018 [Suillus hirtellus]